MDEDLRYIIALMNMRGIGSMIARHLIEVFGSAEAAFKADAGLLLNMPHIGSMMIEQRNDPQLLERADKEISFMSDHHIRPVIYGQEGYPSRLLECQDAPTLLFCLGNANLDNSHIISIVGTRSCTQYGRDMVNNFIAEIKDAIPDAIIVSGLALGIDGASHKAALEHGVNTVGVVAHGLDRIYPPSHRSMASQIIATGGSLVTEYPTGIFPERGNFLARNRIIAGLADAVIVAESRDKGGSLVTASIALDYNREVFAFPGRAGDDRSKGCNRLIRLNRAGLITCAQDFIEAMRWDSASSNNKPIQQSIPFEEDNLTPNGRKIIDSLRDRGDMIIPQLSDATGLDHSTLYEELLDLEMDGKIRTTPGGLYQLR